MPILGIIASAIQKAFASFSDNFNRTTTGSLGTSSSGGMWEALSGTWFANGSSAQSDDAANTYPISFIKSSTENVTMSFVPGSGGTVISTSGTIGSIGTGDGTTGVSGFYWATITGMSSTTGISVGDYITATSGTGSLYGGTPDYVEVTSIIDSTSITYRIKGGTAPTAGTVTNISTNGKDGGSGTSLWITDSGNWYGVIYGRSEDTSCNCSQCGNGTYTCTGYSNPFGCVSWNSSTSAGTCKTYRNDLQINYSGPVQAYTNSYSYKYVTVYSYAQQCITWNPGTTTYTCLANGYQGASCSSSVQNTSTCNCQTCYPPYIQIIKSSSNAVSEIVKWSLTTMAAKIKVVVDSVGKNITVKPYKEKTMTNQIGSDLTQNVSTATTTNKFGIVLSTSDRLQGKNVDDFSIGQN